MINENDKKKRMEELNKYSCRAKNIFDLLTPITIDYDKLQFQHTLILEDKDFKGKILDIGSHFCVFDIVAKLKDQSRDIYCLDASDYACAIGSKLAELSKVKILIFNYLIEEMSTSDKFDSIVALNVIEHINDLDGLIMWLYDALNTNGTLYLSVPYRDYHRDPDHIHYFDIEDNDTYKNIETILKDNCFDTYVSLFKTEDGRIADIFIKCKKMI